MSQGNYREAIPDIDFVLEYIRSVTEPRKKHALVLKAESLFFSKAFCHVAIEDFQKAIPLLNRFIDLYPLSQHLQTAHTLRIHCLVSTSQWEETATALEKALNTFRFAPEERMELVMQLAEVHHSLGRHEQAFPLFGTVMMQAGDPSLKMNAISRVLDSILLLQKTDMLYQLIPMLQGSVSPASYSMQFNLNAIEAADQLMEADSNAPALVLLKLCKPIETIREGLENVEAYLKRRQERLQSEKDAVINNLQQLIAVERRLLRVQAEIEAASTAVGYNEALQYRLGQAFMNLDMLYEAYWAFDRLLEEYPNSENTPLALFISGSLAAELGLRDRAVRKGKELLSRFPEYEKSPETAFNLAYVHQRENEIEELLAVLQDAVDRKIVTRNEQDRGHAYFLMGYANLFLDRFESALLWFDRVKKETPGSRFVPESHYWTAYTHMFTGEYTHAIEKFTVFLKDYPRSGYVSDATYRLALARFGTGDLEGTREATESFLETNPDSALLGDAFNLLGDVYGGLGMLEEALTAYGRVEEFSEKPDQVHTAVFSAGRILEAASQWERMIDHFQRYLNRYGKEGFYTLAVYEIGKAMKNASQTEAAMTLYWDTFLRFAHDPTELGADRILSDYVNEFQNHHVQTLTRKRAESRETDRKAYAESSAGQELLKRMDEAERFAFEKKIMEEEAALAAEDRRNAQREAEKRIKDKLNTERVRTFENEGQRTKELRLRKALALLGDRSAVPEKINIEMIRAGSPDVLLWLGDHLEQREDLDLAHAAYAQVLLELPPTLLSPIAGVKLGQIEFKRDNLEQALNRFTYVYNTYPTSDWAGTAAMGMGDVLFQKGEMEEAAARYQEIVRVREWKGPLWPEAIYKTGLCMLGMGETERAFAFFQRVYVLYGYHEEWASKAYLESGKCLELLNRQPEAASTYREMLEHVTLQFTPAANEARNRIRNLPASAL